MRSYNWASLGCGVIANQLAQAMAKKNRKLYSVANRTYDKAIAFADKYNIDKVYTDINQIFEDENIDIIYISTPHNTHINYIRKALNSGKHVLCEKAITLNSSQLREMTDLASKNNLILAEAMTIYHMPIYKKLKEIISSGKLGSLKLIQMSFGSYKEYNMENRFFSRKLAGGAMLDIGVYALSFIRWFMTSKPNQILSQVKYAPTGVDEQAGILLKNPHDEMAAVMLSIHAKQPKRGIVSFDKGFIEIMEYPRACRATITYTDTGYQQTISDGDTDNAISYEIEDMESAVCGNKNIMNLEYTKDVIDIMTEIRKQWGMKYPEEE